MRYLVALLFGLTLAGGQTPAAQQPTTSPNIAAVKQQMQALRTAELRYDAEAAAKLFADGFLLTSTDGNLYTREQFLKLVGDKSNPLELFEFGEMEVRVYDKTAMVFVRVHEKGFLDGKPYELNGRPTFTWVKQKGVWICVAVHD
ncbi:MAG: nuclear transport factor 2 family protein [Acidobacteriia bacterium]|nr:nuclear transport factor 2 family protein [Terriglobia bacterium]